MNCWHCQTELIWGGDHSMDEEDFPIASQEFGMVTNLSCPKCGSYVEVYLPKDEYRPDFAEEMIKSNKEEPIDTAPCSVEDDTAVCDI